MRNDVQDSGTTVGDQIRQAVEGLVALRQRPCLALLAPMIDRADAVAVKLALQGLDAAALDVVVGSHGGDLDACFLVARELRRHASQIAVFAPCCVKSAAGLIGLVADELVLGGLGELGPLDPQVDEKQDGDPPVRISTLSVSGAFQQLQASAVGLYEETIKRILNGSPIRTIDAASAAADLVGNADVRQLDSGPQNLGPGINLHDRSKDCFHHIERMPPRDGQQVGTRRCLVEIVMRGRQLRPVPDGAGDDSRD